MKKFKDVIRLYFTGLAMGTADLIPGVSGGTIAFLAGIYEELLFSIKILTGKAVKLILKGKVVQAIKVIPFRFLIPLGMGILSAILLLAKTMSFLLNNYPVFIWSFFFGLVIASIFIVVQRIKTITVGKTTGFIFAAIITFFVVGAVPVETPNTLLAFFLSGALAICAMILPGISGSFILLILGKYQQILQAVLDHNILILAVFFAGCVIGITFFSRLLSWLFAKHHDISVSILAGIMLGSLRKIWPWKETILSRINSHGDLVPLVQRNLLPPAFDQSLLLATLLFLSAIVLMVYFQKVQLDKEKVKDVDSRNFSKEHKNALKR